MHPVKGRAVIQTADHVYGVDTFVVDHRTSRPRCWTRPGREGLTIVVRVKTPPVEGTFYHLAAKFGAEPAEAAALLKEAHRAAAQVGLCFHVGSQCLVPGAYSMALKIIGQVLAEAAGTPIQILDVGGGFPAEYIGTNMPPLEAYIDGDRGRREGAQAAPRLRPHVRAGPGAGGRWHVAGVSGAAPQGRQALHQ